MSLFQKDEPPECPWELQEARERQAEAADVHTESGIQTEADSSQSPTQGQPGNLEQN